MTTRGHRLSDTHPDLAAGPDHRPDQHRPDTQCQAVGPVQTPTSDQGVGDTQLTLVTGGSDSLQARGYTKPKSDPPAGDRFPADHRSNDTQGSTVGGEQDRNGSAATTGGSTPRHAPSLADPFLALSADILNDAEDNLLANQNRLRALTRGGWDDPRIKSGEFASPDELPGDVDGIERGLGMDESHPDVARLAALVGMLKQIDHQATLNLARRMRHHPLGPWVKAQKGVGEKQAARLLAVIGDPYWNDTEDRPRLVSELWSYCGHGDARRRIRKGMTQAELFACGNPAAKMRLHLIAEKCLQAQGPYADVYYARKEATGGRLHADECRRCGPAGHPAQPGSPWPAAHRHADALRITGKAILRDLWTEAHRMHQAAR